jgi:hypothetical protein
MEMRRDDFDLTAELRALRPSPGVAFTDELDARVAAGFVESGEQEEGLLGPIARALRNSSPRRLVLPAGAVALTALVVATAVIATGEMGNKPSFGGVRLSESPPPSVQFSDAPRTSASGPPPGAEKAASGAGFQSSRAAVTPTPRHRAVERDAELVLRTQPGEIGKASREVFGAVHAANGVVLSSSVRDRGEESSARFQLLVPNAQLGDTLASLSQIADVRSRHESTLDITAPTVSVGDRLKDSEATIEGVLTQLGVAESYGERALLERQLRQERQRAAVLRSRLDHLRQRASFARVSVLIESGGADDSTSGAWGIGDALGDAGRILTIAAGVAVVGLAVLGPLVPIGLLAWLAYRTLLRQRRERALS